MNGVSPNQCQADLRAAFSQTETVWQTDRHRQDEIVQASGHARAMSKVSTMTLGDSNQRSGGTSHRLDGVRYILSRTVNEATCGCVEIKIFGALIIQAISIDWVSQKIGSRFSLGDQRGVILSRVLARTRGNLRENETVK